MRQVTIFLALRAPFQPHFIWISGISNPVLNEISQNTESFLLLHILPILTCVYLIGNDKLLQNFHYLHGYPCFASRKLIFQIRKNFISLTISQDCWENLSKLLFKCPPRDKKARFRSIGNTWKIGQIFQNQANFRN